MQQDFRLAQVNVARMKAPLSDPAMAGFVARLDEINLLAESSKGFIWRLKPEPDSEQQLVAFEDNGLLFNLSVWKSVEDLRAFVYRSAHKDLLRERERWFDRMDTPHLTLWWVPASHVPTVDEALLRLDRLEMLGPTRNSFTFAEPFPPPEKRRPGEEQE